MNKILITGHSGFLGHSLCVKALENKMRILGLSRSCNSPLPIEEIQADLTQASFIDCLKNLEIDGIIHLAANGNVGDCEINSSESYKINVESCRPLATFAKQRDIPLVFTSSDQVFDGEKGHYSPIDEAKPLNAYGRQKLEAEKSIRDIYPKAVICRMPLMIGDYGGYEKAFVKHVKAGKLQTLFTDEIRSVLNAQQAAEWLLQALHWEGGIYHLPGPKDMNRYELGLHLAEKHGLDLSLIKAGKQSDVDLSVRRPKNTTMIR